MSEMATAHSMLARGQQDDATRVIREVLEAALGELAEEVMPVMAVLTRAVYYIQLGELTASCRDAEEALDSARAMSAGGIAGLALEVLGAARYRLGHFECALEAWSAAIDSFRMVEVFNGAARTGLTAGSNLLRRRDPRSVAVLEGAVSDARVARCAPTEEARAESRCALAFALERAGRAHFRFGQVQLGVADLHEAQRVLQHIGSKREAAEVSRSLSSLLAASRSS
ncbi:hypothetical protein [Subtercola lobariae]|uniref:MalT-like TPR region domain-containing protein n=1 Tax=Subtercola lobariae TaxID=1588641 RepID=A0A917EVG8_9MICO|nr:hypothetical protein [Subtercola lobariae]GGF20474.1 hypothetical protein GCM10011399_12600 [Subtercola lobariae]